MDYTKVNIEEDEQAYDHILAYGYTGAPVIEIIDEGGVVIDHFSGYQVTKLEHHFPKNEGK